MKSIDGIILRVFYMQMHKTIVTGFDNKKISFYSTVLPNMNRAIKIHLLLPYMV